MPIALPAQACKNCVIPWCAEFDQFTDATAHPAPPFPVTHAGANPSTTNGHTVVLLPRVNPSRILLMSVLPRSKQISPDKNVNFPCTTAAFTLSHEPSGFVVLCQLAQRLNLIKPAKKPQGFKPGDEWRPERSVGDPAKPGGPKETLDFSPRSFICGFCPSARTFALRLPSDGRSSSRPCLRLVLLVVFISTNTIGSRIGDLHSISSRPCRAYTNKCSGWLTASADFCR